MAIGPVQLVVLGFQNPQFHGEIIAELERLRAGKPAPAQLIRMGWRGAITGGIVGLLIAWSICTAKERTAQGEFFTYDAASREKGKLILWTALAVLAVLAVAAAALAIWVSV